jgi:NADH:ubiquinone oxidoreductase subunit D
MARSIGLKKDLRLSFKHNYSKYNTLNIRSFLGINGDCYDRYLIRMLEMGESLNIVNTLCNFFLTNSYNDSKLYQQTLNKY